MMVESMSKISFCFRYLWILHRLFRHMQIWIKCICKREMRREGTERLGESERQDGTVRIDSIC